MELVIPLLLGLAALTLLYINLVATFITAIDPTINGGLKVARIIIVWILPVYGAGLTLRFSEQEHNSKIHRKLIPALFYNWIYSNKAIRPNPNADDHNNWHKW